MSSHAVSVTIPAWLTLVIGIICILISLQIARWYFDPSQPYPYFGPQLPFIAKKDENTSKSDEPDS